MVRDRPGELGHRATTRRVFLERLGAVCAGSVLLAACGEPVEPDAASDASELDARSGAEAASSDQSLRCNDPLLLEDIDIQQRSALGYVELSTQAGQSCSNCRQFEAATAAGACGHCRVIPSTINPAGWCSVWVASS